MGNVFPSNKDAKSVIPQDSYLHRKPGDVSRMSPDDPMPHIVGRGIAGLIIWTLYGHLMVDFFPGNSCCLNTRQHYYTYKHPTPNLHTYTCVLRVEYPFTRTPVVVVVAILTPPSLSFFWQTFLFVFLRLSRSADTRDGAGLARGAVL